ncbi:hypothetical protein A9168_16150 [Macellibacteroides sp. HH-ZS]|nr:hypothetical protein A9168_16150 [Macellibacteroides sp. HH-ZS]
MDVEKLLSEGIVFKGAKNPASPEEVRKIKTKAKKSTYAKGTHGSDSAKMKAEIKRRKAARSSQKKRG